MPVPKISVVVPSYNQGHYLDLTLAIIVEQGYPNLELIIMDGGSTDGSVKVIQGTAHARLGQYQMALGLLMSNPLMGASAEVQERLQESISYIHNMWLKELVQGGVATVLALIGMIMHGIRNSTNCLAITPTDHAARVRVAFLVSMIFSTQFNPSGTAIFWMLLGVGLAKVCVAPSGVEQKVMDEPSTEPTSRSGTILRKRRLSTMQGSR